MTVEEAQEKGYRVIRASDMEVGLVCGNHGILTWWAREFDCKLPSLDHPTIMKHIEINESLRP